MRTLHNILSMLLPFTLLGQMASVQAGGFDEGTTRASVLLGSGAAFGESYTVFGGGVDYMVNSYLHVGVDAQFWRSAEPAITKVSPQLGVVMGGNRLRPYAGVFYRKTWIEDFENLASVGTRAGVWLAQGRRAHIGIGYVFESYLDCDTATFVECDDSYPEFVISIAFGK